MANLTFKLEEQLPDQRSNQIAYKLTIENRDSKPIRLLSVEPLVPIGVSVLQIRNTSLAEANARKSALIGELNQLLRDFLWVTSDTFRKTWIEKQKEAIKEILSVRSIFTLYLGLLFDRQITQKEMRRKFESLFFKVASASDARAAYARWMDSADDQQVIRSLFEAKTEQLERVESHMDEGDRQGLTAIEAASVFTATYVLKFVRGCWNRESIKWASTLLIRSPIPVPRRRSLLLPMSRLVHTLSACLLSRSLPRYLAFS